MRDLINLTDEQIEEKFDDLGIGVCVSEEYGCDVVFTRDTIAGFVEAAKDYHSHGRIEQDDEDGTLIIEAVQIRPGDTRKDVYVVDFGEVRGVVY